MKSTSGIATVAAVAFGMISCETTPEEDAAIWNKPPRYGHGGTQATQEANAAGSQQKANRFGFGGENPADGQAENPAGNAVAANGTVPGPGNTLGTTPGESTVPANQGAGDGKMDQKKTDQKKDDTPKTEGSDSKSSPPNNLKSYPFGKPVPGKSGFVTLPSPHDGLGEIDVRGIAPGTPVEIPDPGKPGKKIYFRVP